jgi:concanavalin A-like lectin/glucanase superfamily protein
MVRRNSDAARPNGRGRAGRRAARPLAVVAAALGAGSLALMPVAAHAAANKVAVWHFDETSGTSVKDSASYGGTSNGTAHNVTRVAGKSGEAYEFNGKSSYISVPTSDALNPKTADITMTISLKTTSLPSKGDRDIIRKGYFDKDGGREYKIELQKTGQASCGFGGTSNYRQIIAGPTNLANGEWHTVSCTKTSSAIKLTVDGKSYSRSIRIGSIYNTQPVVIGAHPGGHWYKGVLDEASITIG